jgi:hypothetical protein
LKPTIVTENSNDGAMGAMQSLTQSRGAVPHSSVINLGDQLLVYSLPEATNDPGAVDLVNHFLDATNQPPIAKSTFDALPQSVRETLVKSYFQMGQEVADAKNAGGLAAQWRGTADSYHGTDPATKERLNTIATSYEKARDYYAKNSADLIKAKADAKTAMAGADAVYAHTPDGQVIYTSRDQAPPRSIVQKVSPKQAEEDQERSNRLDDVEKKMNDYKDSMRVPISSSDQTAIGTLEQKFGLDFHGMSIDLGKLTSMQAAGQSVLSPQAQDRLIAYRQAQEAINGYQKVLTGSGKASDKAMELNLATVPAPNDNETYAAKAIDAFMENIPIIRQGMPKFPKAPATPASTPKVPLTPTSPDLQDLVNSIRQ